MRFQLIEKLLRTEQISTGIVGRNLGTAPLYTIVDLFVTSLTLNFGNANQMGKFS